MSNEIQNQTIGGQGVSEPDTAKKANEPDTAIPAETAQAIRRYMEIQREMARLEQEKEDLRNLIVKELEGQVPGSWRPTLDSKPLIVMHGYRTTVKYDEALLKERLGRRYYEILELDGTKIRKNRELVRPYLEAVMDQIGTPQATRVESAIRAGIVTAEEFRGAFKKTTTPFVSIRVDTAPGTSTGA